MDDFAAADFAGGFEHVARAFDIDLIHRRVIAHPQRVAGRDVEAPFAAFHFALQQFTVENVAGHAVKLQPLQAALVRARPQQRLDPVSARQQFVDKVRPDETGSAGDKAFHKKQISSPNLKPLRGEIPTNNSAARLTCRARLEKIAVTCQPNAARRKN